ncbi:beta-lactamase/transpeptidase-like protein [Trichodelitschia bisporula]|uniref:Beta-lactamase/transpeptidase-like protein n=1 Tax=Trichodelitschia bisporula TaxID=703511 RepID=A0A6G1HYX2_9PEZI|nr:beta-lactamase/transpeptidase-like protein [Trichodelitschia bisporula]
MEATSEVPDPTPVTPSGLTSTQLCSRLSSIVERSNAPAIAVAIQHPNGVETAIHGIRKHGQATAASSADSFMFGPITSTLVPIVLSKLIARGNIRWTDTLADLAPDLVDEIHPAHAATTVEMLATHTSGLTTKLPELRLDGYPLLPTLLRPPKVNSRGTLVLGREMIAEAAMKIPPRRTPGPGSDYRNAVNLIILAYIAEMVTGGRWDTLLQTEVFDPLGMQGCGLGQPPYWSDGSALWPHHPRRGLLVPFKDEDFPDEWLSCMPTFPALGVHGTLQDLAAYLGFCLGYKSLGFSDDERKRLYTLNGGTYVPGGFDVVHPAWTEGPVLQCKGHVSGFSTGIWVAAEAGFAFAIVVNVDYASGAAVRDEVYELLTSRSE